MSNIITLWIPTKTQQHTHLICRKWVGCQAAILRQELPGGMDKHSTCGVPCIRRVSERDGGFDNLGCATKFHPCIVSFLFAPGWYQNLRIIKICHHAFKKSHLMLKKMHDANAQRVCSTTQGITYPNQIQAREMRRFIRSAFSASLAILRLDSSCCFWDTSPPSTNVKLCGLKDPTLKILATLKLQFKKMLVSWSQIFAMRSWSLVCNLGWSTYINCWLMFPYASTWSHWIYVKLTKSFASTQHHTWAMHTEGSKKPWGEGNVLSQYLGRIKFHSNSLPKHFL